MKSPHILLAGGNVTKLKNNLISVIDANAIRAIEKEINLNTRKLYILGKTHFLFAKKQNRNAWRQKISRLYYGGYNVSRAVRLCVNGEYSVDSSDHKKIGTLPDDFPTHHSYGLRLQTLRDDRNLCDYDHTVSCADLSIGTIEATELVDSFLQDARVYLRNRGIII
jgi:hypothetical protein